MSEHPPTTPQLPIWIGVVLLAVIAVGVFFQRPTSVDQQQLRQTLGTTPVWVQNYPQDEYKPEPLMQSNEERMNKIRQLQGQPPL